MSEAQQLSDLISDVYDAALDPAGQAAEQAKLKPLMRTNTYDPASGDLVVGERRAQAIAQVAAHYESLFSNDPATAKLREGYAMREDTIPDATHRRELTAFFFWSAWATTTQRPPSWRGTSSRSSKPRARV